MFHSATSQINVQMYKNVKERGKEGLQRKFCDVDSFIVLEPWGEISEYSLSLRYKRMKLSGDGHESKTQLISNPVQGGLLYKMKVLNKQTLNNNSLYSQAFSFWLSEATGERRGGGGVKWK